MPTRISYDGMSRLTAAGYLENGKRNDHFSTSYKYDLMGNILSLRREGLLNSGSYGTIDDLTYSYKGNQVVKIDDAAEESPSYKGAMHFRDYADEETEYTYDANGNMLTDSNKGITSIDYNVLDLPQCISTKSRVLFKENSNDTIYYTYSADGTKLRSTYKKAEYRVYPYNPETSLTSFNVETGLNVGTVGMAKPIAKRLKTKYYYCSNLVYDNENISAILFDGGYASVDDDNGIVMHFYVKDHLGSNRLVVDGNGNIEEVNHYYPFGALMGDRCGVSQNKYKYIGKELDTMYGWNMQDHEARWYDPVVGRWMVTDPLQEIYRNVSSYSNCLNNPLRLIDPDGMVVIVSDLKAKRNIINTLSIEESKYIQFDDKGILNDELLSKYEGFSENFMALKSLSKSSINYIFEVSDKDINGKQFYEKGTNHEYPQNYSYAVTNLPGAENDPSIDDNVYIFTASFLDERTQARNTAHEGYGHAYFYELSRKNSSINPGHTFIRVGFSKEYDSELKMEIMIPIFEKNNVALEQQIRNVEQQALENYDKKHN